MNCELLCEERKKRKPEWILMSVCPIFKWWSVSSFIQYTQCAVDRENYLICIQKWERKLIANVWLIIIYIQCQPKFVDRCYSFLRYLLFVINAPEFLNNCSSLLIRTELIALYYSLMRWIKSDRRESWSLIMEINEMTSTNSLILHCQWNIQSPFTV